MSQPRGGHIELGLERDFLGGEHPPTVLAPSATDTGPKVPTYPKQCRHVLGPGYRRRILRAPPR
jgi:hypothetical protein